MTVRQLVYISKAKTGITRTHIADILFTSRYNNKIHGITGFLIFLKGFFLQVLEGDFTQVNNLLKNILSDERHSGLEIVQDRFVEIHEFITWSMAFVDVGELDNIDVIELSDIQLGEEVINKDGGTEAIKLVKGFLDMLDFKPKILARVTSNNSFRHD